jgi:hypothetical protein
VYFTPSHGFPNLPIRHRRCHPSADFLHGIQDSSAFLYSLDELACTLPPVKGHCGDSQEPGQVPLANGKGLRRHKSLPNPSQFSQHIGQGHDRFRGLSVRTAVFRHGQGIGGIISLRVGQILTSADGSIPQPTKGFSGHREPPSWGKERGLGDVVG